MNAQLDTIITIRESAPARYTAKTELGDYSAQVHAYTPVDAYTAAWAKVRQPRAVAYAAAVDSLPAPLTNADRQALTREWLACGMSISDVRRQLAQHPVRIELGA